MQLDSTGQRCLVYASKKTDYERAIQSGKDAAMGGMAVQQDIMRRLGVQ